MIGIDIYQRSINPHSTFIKCNQCSNSSRSYLLHGNRDRLPVICIKSRTCSLQNIVYFCYLYRRQINIIFISLKFKVDLQHSKQIVTTCDSRFKLPIMTRRPVTQDLNKSNKEVVYTFSQLLNVTVIRNNSLDSAI